MKANSNFKNKDQYVRRRTGEKCHPEGVIPMIKHPTKLMIWSVISGKDTAVCTSSKE